MKSRKKQDTQQKASLKYEEVAAYLLNRFAKEFELKFVEGKQKIQGRRSGTKWTIDAKGVAEGNEGFFIVECRRYTTSKQNQEKVGGLAYRISDSGAAGGIIVSPFGLQEGGAKVAAAENIISVKLNADSTPTEFCIPVPRQALSGHSRKVRVERNCFSKVFPQMRKMRQESRGFGKQAPLQRLMILGRRPRSRPSAKRGYVRGL